MFNFNGITHIIENPVGHALGYNYSLVGAVPLSMLDRREPTAADVMAGRVQSDGFAYHGRKWDTVQAITDAALANGVNLCSALTCGCRRLIDTTDYFAKKQRAY